MTVDVVISLATGAGVVGVGLAALALARLVRAERQGDVAAMLALVAATGLAAVGFATAAALLQRPAAEPTASPPAVAQAPQPPLEGHGGRALAADATRLHDAHEVEWPLLRIRLRVPADWVVRTLSATALEVCDPVAATTFVAARAAPLPAGPTIAQYLEAHVTHVREAFDARRIEGFTTRRMGTVPGVLTIEHRAGDAAWAISWTGFEPAEVGPLVVTITAGASDADFDRDEPLLGAVLSSIRFD